MSANTAKLIQRATSLKLAPAYRFKFNILLGVFALLVINGHAATDDNSKMALDLNHPKNKPIMQITPHPPVVKDEEEEPPEEDDKELKH